MSHGMITVALAAAMQVGQPAPTETPNYPPLQNAYNQYGFEGQFEQRLPFDSHQNWMHGYHQEIPAYNGHVFFRPYNYKDVLSQSQTAAGWGMSPTMPYSQQFWHRYHDQATMLKLARTGSPATTPISAPAATMAPSTVLPAGAWSGPALVLPSQQLVLPAQSGLASPIYVDQSQVPQSYQQPVLNLPVQPR